MSESGNKDYYSNCLFEAIKAKLKWGKQVQIIYIPAKKILNGYSKTIEALQGRK